MAYQTDAVKNAQKIFYYLLEHHELREENAPALYKAYIEQNEVQELVKSQADIADCSIVELFILYPMRIIIFWVILRDR